jgi:hypothetical protein
MSSPYRGDLCRQLGGNGEDDRPGAAVTRLGRAQKQLVTAIEDAVLHQAAPPFMAKGTPSSLSFSSERMFRRT